MNILRTASQGSNFTGSFKKRIHSVHSLNWYEISNFQYSDCCLKPEHWRWSFTQQISNNPSITTHHLKAHHLNFPPSFLHVSLEHQFYNENCLIFNNFFIKGCNGYWSNSFAKILLLKINDKTWHWGKMI